jgi:hypothetical protein
MTTGSRTFAASILRDHFDTEASDAGLRSADLASAGGGGWRSFDASAVARFDRSKARALFGHEHNHRRVRETLKRLQPKHVELLSLAYETRLRSRDIEDGKKRRAVRQVERNWRVRLAELYGQEGMIVLASPLASKLFAEHVLAREAAEKPSHDDSGMIAWLLDAGRTHQPQIEVDVRQRLDEALDAFAGAYGVTTAPSAQRQRSSEKTRTRILASHFEHGHEIGG